MGKRAERRKARVKQQVGPALYQVMMPGEKITGGVLGHTGLPPTVVMAAGLAGVVIALASLVIATISLIRAARGLPTPFFPSGVFVLLPIMLASQLGLRRPEFLAVTGRQAICFRVSQAGTPVKLLFAVPLTDVRVTAYRPGGRYASLRCEAPEPYAYRARRLAVHRLWQPDLDALIAALAATGSVAPA
jgi:hypothetical protein